MFEFIYSKAIAKGYKKVIRRQYDKKADLIPLLWTEHCIECAAPTCYATCKRYKRRSDGNCIRIVGGVSPIITDEGLGAEVEFRTWAKIESQLNIKPITSKTYSLLYRSISAFGHFFRGLANLAPNTSIQRFIDAGWFSYRQKVINAFTKKRTPIYALSLHGKLKNKQQETTLLVDVKSASKHLFRESIQVPLGDSEFFVSIPSYASAEELHFINIHPANAEEHIALTFEYLELEPTNKTEGKKVKCVIWDLDNTLWKGVLIEDSNVEVNSQFVELIKRLDRSGIVNSIASKNDKKQVMDKLKALGIDEYFIFNKINWNPKSINIGKTIEQMNINPNTIVFVDDNPFERNEVSLRYPSITCIDPSEILSFSTCKRFNTILTEDSQKRRSTYKMLESLKEEEDNWTGNIDDFLQSCRIKANLSRPTEETLPRCYELLQRTNQLNASGRRLSLDEVTALVNSERADTYVLRSSDKFGDYGIVGFLIVDKSGDIPCITDFVISCRVANKKIEPTLVNYLSKKYNGKVLFNYKKTNRNGPMFALIDELKMERVASKDGVDVYSCSYNDHYPQIVMLEEFS
jgi:fkbH domain